MGKRRDREEVKPDPFSQGTSDSPGEAEASRAWEITRGSSWDSTATGSDRVAPPDVVEAERRQHLRIAGGGSIEDEPQEAGIEAPPDPEETHELTGYDASAGEADPGSASPTTEPPSWEEDRTLSRGAAPEGEAPLEADPGQPSDILPDSLEEGASPPSEEAEAEITARPSREQRPIPPELLPAG